MTEYWLRTLENSQIWLGLSPKALNSDTERNSSCGLKESAMMLLLFDSSISITERFRLNDVSIHILQEFSTRIYNKIVKSK